MKKNLKIKFWKAEKALAMQIVEQEGLPKEKHTGIVKIAGSVDIYDRSLYLRGKHSSFDFDISLKHFGDNEKRDDYLDKITKAITDELFSGDGELKVGELCEVRDYDNTEWEERELITVLPPKFKERYIVKREYYDNEWVGYMQARPLGKRIEPKVEVNGEIVTYTWEEE